MDRPHAVIVGAGMAGLAAAIDLASAKFKVTVLERGGQIAGREDSDISAAIREFLVEEGIRIVTGVSDFAAERDGDGRADREQPERQEDDGRAGRDVELERHHEPEQRTDAAPSRQQQAEHRNLADFASGNCLERNILV